MLLPSPEWDPMSPSFRAVYLSLLPSLLLLVLPPAISFIPRVLPRTVKHYLVDIPQSYIGPFITLHDLYPPDKRPKQERPRWKTVILVGGALAQLQHVVLANWKSAAFDAAAAEGWVVSGLLGACWLYAAGWPLVVRRRATANPALLAFYVVQLVATALTFLTWLYARNVHPATPRLSVITIVSTAVALVVNVILVGVTLSLPIVELPEAYVKEQKKREAEGSLGYSPEDRTTFGGWLTFAWVYPLIVLGRGGYLKDADLWDLSPVSRSAALYTKFATSSHLSILHRIAKANGMDIGLDFILSYASIVLNYAAPFLVKRIIEALGDPTRENLSRGYVLATLALSASLLKAQMDLNKLWRGRRGCVRTNTEISGAIFAKLLVAKDASGVTEGKGTSSTGKIVQLATNDAGSIAQMVPALSMIYGAPFELIVCCTFLYWILSWSAFVGIFAICLLMPVQGWLTSVSYSIYHEYRKASDERTNLMTEIINSIKVIKFFGWEQRFLDKADAVRAKELRLSVKQSLISLVYSCSGTLTPLIVTVVSFFCYVQIQKKELTVSVAFTAMSLFGMLQSPLTNLPMFVVHVTQTIACAVRVDAYLKEDEVADGVSTLKSAPLALSATAPADTRIGFVGGARFRWNAGKPEVKDKKDDAKSKTKTKAKDKKTNGAAVVEAPVAVEEEPTPVFELGDISFIFPAGALTIVSGPTGGGKTALLHALLGEMDLLHGSIALPKDTSRFDEDGLTNSVAYAGQTAWLQNLTIKGNILFGAPLDEARYNATLKACSLLPDLKILEDGDETEIGAKGVSLSGGQKARVALARAVYSRAKHVLLDDPLAAVDSHTAAALVSDCLASPLLKNRTVIIVSHHVELLLPIAHSIIHVVDGRVDASGTVAELRANGHLGEIVSEEEKAHAEEETVVDETPVVDAEEVKVKKAARKMTEDEERTQGNVGLRTYGVFLSAASWSCAAAIATLMLISDNASIAERWWIAVWTRPVDDTVRAFASLAARSMVPDQHAFLAGASASHAHHAFASAASSNATAVAASSLPVAKEHPLWYLGIYLAIALAFFFTDLIRNLIGYLGKYRASKILHAKLIRSIMRATPRWFDVTPTGRVLNRVTKDIMTIDQEVLDMITMVARSVASVLGSLVLILVFLPTFIIPTAVLGYIYFRLAVAYLRCQRDLQRIKAVTLSPIISGFDTTLIGIVTIRAFSAEKRFLDEFHGQMDTTTAAEWWIWMCNRWLLYRFDAIGAFTTYTAIVLVLYTETSAALGGMIILSSSSIMMSIYWCARFFSEMTTSMNSVERVNEYLSIPQEARLHIPESAPPAYWPSNSGETLISVEDLVISYDPSLPPVLHGVSFDCKPREKIGLIGRTGSGKSTLGMSFLRFAEATSGKIIIDGIDISTLGLQTLREKVTIVTQDPILFSGTLRSNLDPFEEHTDEELNDILHRVQLGLPSTSAAPSRVASSSNVAKLDKDGEDALKANSVTSGGKITVTLDSEVSSGGQNFSQGQRQLIALGRALVRNNNVLIMDEATASVDFETDNLIQQTIREEFSNSALLTIAHRLSSIIDYDRLLVLDAGRVVEFDTPYALLSKKAGDDKAIFRGMCEKSGRFDELFASAEKKAKSG